MDEKKLIKIGGKLARELINLLEEELTGEKRKTKKEKKDGKGRKQLSCNTSSTNSSS